MTSLRSVRRVVALLTLLAASLASSAAFADPIDAEAKTMARKLGHDAVKLYESGDYAAAFEKFDTANTLVPTPTLGLFTARCLVKLGRLVEASERYLEVTRMHLERGAPPLMRKAQADAVAEREKLLPTIPSLELRIDGPRGAGVTVTVDEHPLLLALLGEKRPIDPGKHKIVATRIDTAVSEDVDIAAGSGRVVLLTMPPLPLPPAPPVAKTPLLQTAGRVSAGAGAGFVVFGLVNGLIAIGAAQSVLKACPNHVCPTQAALDKDGTYNATRALSTTGFVVGAIGLAAGLPIIFLTPKTAWVHADGTPAPAPSSASNARIEAGFTAGGAIVRGMF